MAASTLQLVKTDAGAPVATLAGLIQALWSIKGADMNITTDQPFFPAFDFTSFVNFQVNSMRAFNASTSLTTAAGGLYTAAAKGGTVLIAAATVYTAATGAGAPGQVVAVNAPGSGLIPLTTPPILNLTTAQGGAATADIIVYGALFR